MSQIFKDFIKANTPQIIEYIKEGNSPTKIAKKLNIAPSTLINYFQNNQYLKDAMIKNNITLVNQVYPFTKNYYATPDQCAIIHKSILEKRKQIFNSFHKFIYQLGYEKLRKLLNGEKIKLNQYDTKRIKDFKKLGAFKYLILNYDVVESAKELIKDYLPEQIISKKTGLSYNSIRKYRDQYNIGLYRSHKFILVSSFDYNN